MTYAPKICSAASVSRASIASFRILSERRKADRALMLKAVKALADGYGFAHRTVTHVNWDDETVRIEIEAGPDLALSVGFQAKGPSGGDVWVVPWHTTLHSTARLDTSFGRVGGLVNPHHFGKCTGVSNGFDGLMADLRRGFDMVRDGSAFQERQEPQYRPVWGTRAQDTIDTTDSAAMADMAEDESNVNDISAPRG